VPAGYKMLVQLLHADSSAIIENGGATMKKVIIALLVCTSLLALPSCSLLSRIKDATDKTDATEKTDEDETKKTTKADEKETVEDETKKTTAAVTKPQNGDISIDEQVVLDQGGIKVTLKSLDMESTWGPTISLQIENNSDKAVSVQSMGSSVNGVMISTWFSCDIGIGKKANTELSYMTEDLDRAGITVIKDIEFYLNVYDTETYDTIFDSDMIKVTTSADPSYVQAYDTSGTVVFDKDGYKFIVQGSAMDDSYWGAVVYVYIENNSDKNINVFAQNVSIDGFMIDPYFSCEVYVGKKAYTVMTFMDEDLVSNGIEKIGTLEFDLIISDALTWETLDEAKTLSVTF